MSESNNEKSRIDMIKKDLYSRNPRMGLNARNPKYDPEPDYSSAQVKDDWDSNSEKMDEERLRYKLMQMDKKSPLKKIFAVSLIFFLAAVSYAAYTFYYGANEISSEKVDIEITGPASVRGGEEIPLDLVVKNGNNATIESVRLEITYPDGSRSADDLGRPLVRESFQIGRIMAGGESAKKVSAIMFGETNSFKTFSFLVEYRVEGSNGLFTKEKKYEVFINSSPVTISIESVKEIVSNKEFEISVAVISESLASLTDLAMNVDYGLGFTFLSSSPSPLSGQRNWYVGSLGPGSRKVIMIRGKLDGQDGEERYFGFSVGTTEDKDVARVDVPMLTASQKILIRRPFVAADLSLNGDTTGDLLAESGVPIKGEIILTNNLSERLADVSVELTMRGDSIDPSSVQVKRGIFDSVNKKITWQARGDPSLAVVAAGDQITLPFVFNTFQGGAMASRGLKNQEISFDAVIKAKRFSEDRVPEEVSAELSKKIKVETEFLADMTITRGSGPFANSGPMPPRVDQETTYTVLWRISNSLNNVTDSTMTAIIPQYVRWLSKIDPTTEDVSFNEITGELTWKSGEIAPGAGYGVSPREVFFQVALKPGLNLIDTSPVIIGPTVLRGVDRFTGKAVSDAVKSVTTRIESEGITGTKSQVAR